MMTTRSAAGPESLSAHTARFGPCPSGSAAIIELIGRSGLRGRGGAGFPAGTKWRSVAGRAQGRGVVVVNGVEADPLSSKDRLLMTSTPHLVLDGALIAAQSVGAGKLVIAINRRFADARQAIEGALRERRPSIPTSVVDVPSRYVAGEESALVHLLNGGEAKPTLTPPRPFEKGVNGKATLVNNVETLAWAALIARHGEAWFRALGTPDAPGAVLINIAGAVERPGVYEFPASTTVDAALATAGTTTPIRSVLIGGYFGRWLALNSGERVSEGGGMLLALPESACGVTETARMVHYLAGESARQCGPCFNGLPAVAAMTAKLANGRARSTDVDRLRRWMDQLAVRRGACHHPDGTIRLLRSAFQIFDADIYGHLKSGSCGRSRSTSLLPTLGVEAGWQ